ncbi:hypothetical protein RM533_01920 [Croceicoccus sp. F390]|uniref:Uncharacterized protein n=1 Tax=Croceicoccus esteveae TaxID=3075597 RepID=A0ABU2ZFT2_9SPHN|nr:hypothetical protein [Croceicoccus sp. F390]MDT0574938.1 hypothetical protein [Croceicoccus sp. F390]
MLVDLVFYLCLVGFLAREIVLARTRDLPTALAIVLFGIAADGLATAGWFARASQG